MSVGLGLPTAEERDSFIDNALNEMGPETVPVDTEDNETKTGDDQSAGNDAAAEKTGDEDLTTEDAAGQEWLDDELRDQVSTLGITDEELSEFTSREELDRALRILDKSAMQAGRKADETGDSKYGKGEETDQQREERQRDSRGRFETKPDKKDVPDSYQVQLDPESYDEEVVKEFNSMRDHYETKLQAIEQRFAAFEQAEQLRDEAANEQRFDSIVDSLGMPELFGESGKESKSELKNRQKLYEDHKAYLHGLRVLGREGKTDKSFVSRVVNMTFAEHLSKKRETKNIQKAKQQAKQRTGGGSTKSVAPKYAGPVEHDPELLALHDELAGADG
jgi:hypothetical protein